MAIDPFSDQYRHLNHLQDYVLLDIARNDSAQMDYRLFAVELLQARKSPKLQHPDIQHLVQELEIELDGIVFEHPAPATQPTLSASVTTRTLYGDPGPVDDPSIDTILNGGFNADEAIEDDPINVSPTTPAPASPEPTTKDKPDAT